MGLGPGENIVIKHKRTKAQGGGSTTRRFGFGRGLEQEDILNNFRLLEEYLNELEQMYKNE